MKKIIMMSALLIGASSVFAQVGGGFAGPSAGVVMTVQQALKKADDTPVILKGHIVNSLGDEKYTFKDATGEIIVEIDNEDWHGLNVTPEDMVEITGDVDKELLKPTKIDVDSIRIQ